MNIYLCGALVLMLSTLVVSQQASVAAEEELHHRLVLKNDSVMVLRVKLQPGESTLFHTHLYDRVTVDLSNTTITRQKLGEPESSRDHETWRRSGVGVAWPIHPSRA